MKKTILIILSIILGVVLVFVGYYVGKDKQPVIDSKSEFDKEVQCAALYPSVKQYIYDQYEYGEPDVDYVGYSRVNSIELRYSYYADRCIASVDYDRMEYRYEIRWENYYNMIQTQKLLDINDWYKSIYTCEYNLELNADCRMKFIEKKGLYR